VHASLLLPPVCADSPQFGPIFVVVNCKKLGVEHRTIIHSCSYMVWSEARPPFPRDTSLSVSSISDFPGIERWSLSFYRRRACFLKVDLTGMAAPLSSEQLANVARNL
jgi:hypothetical protein